MTRLRRWAAAVRAALRSEDGQAMAEYASVSTILLLGGLAAVGGWPYFNGFLSAFDSYLGSIYYTLNIPLP